MTPCWIMIRQMRHGSSPKLQTAKNKSSKSGIFWLRAKRGAIHHVSPPNHPNFIIKNHPPIHHFSQNPLEKGPYTKPEKFSNYH
jgi:hypothetical protein